MYKSKGSPPEVAGKKGIVNLQNILFPPEEVSKPFEVSHQRFDWSEIRHIDKGIWWSNCVPGLTFINRNCLADLLKVPTTKPYPRLKGAKDKVKMSSFKKCQVLRGKILLQ